MVNFMHECVWPKYRWLVEPGNDAGIKGNKTDARVLEKARELKVPLVTRERKLTLDARKAGLAVYSPQDFVRDIDKALAVEAYLRRMREAMLPWLVDMWIDSPAKPGSRSVENLAARLVELYLTMQYIARGRSGNAVLQPDGVRFEYPEGTWEWPGLSGHAN